MMGILFSLGRMIVAFFSVWIGRMQGDEDSAFFKMVRVQWWVPTKKGKNLDE
jgi:hypothetical protein